MQTFFQNTKVSMSQQRTEQLRGDRDEPEGKRAFPARGEIKQQYDADLGRPGGPPSAKNESE